MGTGEIDPVVFGGLIADVKTIITQQAEVKADLATNQKEIKADLTATKTETFAKIDKLTDAVEEMKVNGSTVARKNSEDIKEIKGKSKVLIGFWVSIASLVAAGCSVIAVIVLVWRG